MILWASSGCFQPSHQMPLGDWAEGQTIRHAWKPGSGLVALCTFCLSGPGGHPGMPIVLRGSAGVAPEHQPT